MNKTNGGVFIGVTTGLSCNVIEVNSSCELVSVDVRPNKVKLIISSFKRSPDSDDSIAEIFKESLDKISKRSPSIQF